MDYFGYVEIEPPRRFRLRRENGEVVETQLIRKRRELPSGKVDLAHLVLRLEDGTETTLGDLVSEWGETPAMLDYDDDLQ
ncbi:hypothetical protein [Nocardia sp. NPDC051750]|uniref:hypothetical protein n=1 Tax=Nocardia sp. NPDC051750 TaxID=3364325 RepID=UPI00379C3632